MLNEQIEAMQQEPPTPRAVNTRKELAAPCKRHLHELPACIAPLHGIAALRGRRRRGGACGTWRRGACGRLGSCSTVRIPPRHLHAGTLTPSGSADTSTSQHLPALADAYAHTDRPDARADACAETAATCDPRPRKTAPPESLTPTWP